MEATERRTKFSAEREDSISRSRSTRSFSAGFAFLLRLGGLAWAGMFALTSYAEASLVENAVVEIAQESFPGAGDFDANVLGIVETVNDPFDIVTKYAYGNPFNGYNGTAPSAIEDTSLVFVHRDTSTGNIALVSVHDTPGGATSYADQSIELSGDPNGAAWLVQDDPEGETSPPDHYTGSSGDSLFTTDQVWGSANDGYALGSLDGSWIAFIKFDSSLNGQPVDGLTSWFAYSGDGSTIALALDDQRRIRLRPFTEGSNPRVPSIPTTGVVVIVVILIAAGTSALRRSNAKL